MSRSADSVAMCANISRANVSMLRRPHLFSARATQTQWFDIHRLFFTCFNVCIVCYRIGDTVWASVFRECFIYLLKALLFPVSLVNTFQNRVIHKGS